jgi:hypothetical protein
MTIKEYAHIIFYDQNIVSKYATSKTKESKNFKNFNKFGLNAMKGKTLTPSGR